MIAKQSSGAPLVTRESLAVMGAALVLTLMPSMVRASNERAKVNDVGQTEWYSVQGMKCLGCANGFKKDLMAKGEGGLSHESARRCSATSRVGSLHDPLTPEYSPIVSLLADGVDDVVVQWQSEESAQVGVTSVGSEASRQAASKELQTQLQDVCEARGYAYLYSHGGRQAPPPPPPPPADTALSEAPSP